MDETGRFVSIKTKIMLSTLIPVVFSFILICSVNFVSLFNSLHQTAESSLSQISQKHASGFENKMNNAMDYLSIVTGTLETQIESGTADREVLQQTVFKIFDDYGMLDGSSVYFEANAYDGRDAEYVGTRYGTEKSGRICYYFYDDGRATAYLPEALENDEEFTLPHYTEAKESNKPIYTAPTVYEVDGRVISMFTVTYPVRNQAGDFIGAVTVDLFLDDIYTQIQNEEIFKTGYVIIANDNDQLIYTPRFKDLGKTREEAGLNYSLPPEGETSILFYANSVINGKSTLVSLRVIHVPLLERKFYISVAAPTGEINERGFRLLVILIVLSITVILGIAFLLYLLINRILAPIKGITDSANKLANGALDDASAFDLTGRSITSKDEVYVLNDAIKKMLSQISEMQKLRLETLEFKHKKEKAEEAAQAKNDFLAKMSHEIRTPMNAVMGMTELILRKDLPQDVYENACMIKSASTNLLSIINDILDFSKIESGKLEIIEAEYVLPSLLNDVINVIRIRLVEKPIQFAVNVDPNVPAVLFGDEIRLRQILTNLLSNAVKYTAKGYIRLDITGTHEEDTATLKIGITDSGVGIKEEEIGKLFGDFIQIDTVKNRGIEGTGLGLAIARNLCRLMGGDITVESEYGKGSTFTMTLPQRIENYTPFAATENADGPSVLLYETREVYRESIVGALESLKVKHLSVSDIPALFSNMGEYDYLFISSFAYDSINPSLSKLEKPPQLVLLSDITETSSPKGVRTLNLPAHSLTILNALNCIDEEYGDGHISGASFSAPEAKVMIVDDITANLKVGEGLLLPYQMQVILCSSGRDAIARIEEEDFDLVFMDHMMPEMDGLEAARRIRELGHTALPIVALTANAVAGVKEMFVQNGMNDFLAKPIETAKLDAILSKWIPKSKQKKASSSGKTTGKSAFIDNLRSVKELSIDKALKVVGGSAQTYENIVRLSIRLLPENIERLEQLIQADIPNYAIEVHGMKGILNNLGAYELGLKAAQLEELSKNGDRERCQALHPGFINELSAFSDTMNGLVADEEPTEKTSGNEAQFQEACNALEEALEFFDSARAREAIDSIAGITYGQAADAKLNELKQAVELFDFDAATELLQEWKGMVKTDE